MNTFLYPKLNHLLIALQQMKHGNETETWKLNHLLTALQQMKHGYISFNY